MANNRLKKLTALLLSIVMVFSMVTEAFPAAFAAGEGVSTPVTQADGDRNMDFSAADETRRPGLYVDFLGDNRLYQPSVEENERDTTLVSGGVLGSLTAPGLKDQSQVTNEKTVDNPNGTVNQWRGYKDPAVTDFGHSGLYDGNTIFWVGVGISRMNLLELFQENNNGVYSAELGFYYDDRYIEPYTGATANDNAGFLEVIQAANLVNYEKYKWDGYSIVDARTALQPQTDPVTQEVIQKPDMSEIMGKTLPTGETESPWKMTYVSIERTNVDNNRCLYDADEAEEEDLETKYLLIIPFRLKKYDPLWQERVCLRLTRSAGLLSIGSDDGDTPYAAWERVTTRNPGRELKLMTDFQGDLNIFSGGKYLENPYQAELLIRSAGGSGNTARLTIDNDPSPTPVYADRDGEVIGGLYGGTGMHLDVHVETGYTVTVLVYHTSAKSTGKVPAIQYVESWPGANDGTYTFIMPEDNVTVEVIFELDDAQEFWLYLSETEEDAAGNTVDNAVTGIQGNSTVLTTAYPPTTKDTVIIVDKDSPKITTSTFGTLPGEKIHSGAVVKADVKVHHDYEAVLRFYSVAEAEAPGSTGNIAPETPIPLDGTISPDYVMVLPTGGTVYIDKGMPSSDVVVYVTYRPAQRHTAILEVHHKDIDPSPYNVAQLVTTVYTKEDEPRSAYSGVVYQDDNGTLTDQSDDNHRAVEDPFRVLDRVDASSATGSGSLGGDGRAPMDWDGTENSLMALLYKATTATDLNTIKPLDLRWEPTGSTSSSADRQPADGLRKNAIGERYTDSDIGDFYDRLMELQALAKAIAPAAGAANSSDPNVVVLQEVTVTPADGSPSYTYSYYDLSEEQIQAYILDYEAHQGYVAAKAQYDDDKAQYDLDKAAYDQYVADKAAAEAAGLKYKGRPVREPKPPVPPSPVSAPVLLSDADAQARVNTWYDPATATVTPPEQPTAVNDYKLEIRPGRQVAVVLEAESSYTVASGIVIRPAVWDDVSGSWVLDTSPSRPQDIILDTTRDPNDASKFLLTRNPDYQNEFLFDMPDYDCIVEVTYTARKTRPLDLVVVGPYEYSTTPIFENKVEVTGYMPNPVAGSITAAPITPLVQDGDSASEVLVDSWVTVKVQRGKGYTAVAQVTYINASGGTSTLTTNPADTTNLRESDMFTFRMPDNVTTITITFIDDREKLNAHLRFAGDTAGANGVWNGTLVRDTTALEGDTLIADITVEPGYYIYAIETYTTAGSMAATNPVVLSGNGWNNGAGGKVTATTTMPNAEYWVYVYIKKGAPEPEPDPGEILRLQIEDPDNIGDTIADNWARVNDPTTIGPLGLGTTGGNVLTNWDYAKAGDTVKLEFHPDTGYFVESVEVKPAGLGASVTRTSATTAEFTMPAASATVVVTFRKLTDEVQPKGLYLHLAKTEQGGTPTGINTIPNFTSPTILALGGSSGVYTVPGLPATVPPPGGSNTGAAKTGEWVEINVDIAPGWYIESITASDDGGRIPYQLYHTYDRGNLSSAVLYNATTDYDATVKTTAVVTFVMPASDAHITVNYRKGPEDGSTPTPDPHEHEVELLVVDPENVGTGDPLVYADNKASAVVSGVDPDRSIGPVGKAQSTIREATSARAGEEVTIEYAADTGYTLEIILVTPSGLLVPVNYLDSSHARFTMPDSSVTAIVRFKRQPAIRYTANLVLHFPDGTTYDMYDTIGEGTFRNDQNGASYDFTNKLYSRLATPGERLDFDLFAHDGYYISAVTVGPPVLGVPADYTGAFGRQSGHVMMPAANIQINVYFKAGWPDDIIPESVPYDLTLKVYDATGLGSTANFVSIAGTALTAPNTDPVGNGQSLTVDPRQAHDEERVVVNLNPATDCYAKTITVTDSRGQNVPWQYAPGGIAFEMTPAHVTVTVVYAKLPDNDDQYENLEVKLHLGSTDGTNVAYVSDGAGSPMGSAVLTGPNWPTDATLQTSVNGGSYQIRVPRHGQTQNLEVTPNTGYHVTAAYAVKRGTGDILPLVDLSDPSGSVTTSMPQVPSGGTVTFAMPDGNADVYVIFADDTVVPPPEPNDLLATLIVAGPHAEDGTWTSGSAVMQGIIGADTPSPVTVKTRNVDASGADSLYAPQGTELTVDLTVNPGYGIAAIRVTDVYGNKLPYTWTDGTQRQFTLTMPAGGARVYVELEEVDTTKELTAQVVVNNGGGSGNTATLRLSSTPVNGGSALLTPVYAGDGIYVDITVQTGYQIEYLKVVPAKYGIAPSLTKLPVLDQTTSFVMPGEDVVVYVKFTRDDRERKNVTLVAEGDKDPNDPIQNKATVHTVYSGYKGPVYPDTLTNSVTAQAAPPTATLPAEWVTVDYTWAEGYYVTSITVVDSTGNPVPFTQNWHDKINRTGQITFPMVNSDVTVTVTWGTKLVKYPAILHVIDLDNPAESGQSWGKLTWLDPPSGDTSKHETDEVMALPTPGGTETLMVPAGEEVQVDAHAQDGTYIQAAFVLYRVGGQMIKFNFTDPVPADQNGSGDQQDKFIMHPGQNDVYIYYTRIPPNPNDHSAVLMLDSPTDDTTSTATIERTRVPGPDDGLGRAFDSVTANDPNKTHGYVNASQDDTITVTVNPAPGYIIDYILMTPLGIEYPVGTPIVPTRQPDGTYTFTMPNENVAVYVKLKKDESTTYKAYLHYKMVEIEEDGYTITDLDPTKDDDWAQLSFDWGGILTTWNTDGDWRMVPESATVTMGASITQHGDGTADYVLAAYVLKENGDMVPLSDALEGLTETHTTPDRSLLDGTSDFTMPGADVHAYVWFTKEPPADNWRTAVLTVFDKDPGNSANDNSGLNSATLESNISDNKGPVEVWSTGEPGHKFLWVVEGETVTVKTSHIEPGYSFVDATITHSLASATQTLTDASGTTPPPYVFTYTVEGYNSAVVVNYVKSELTRNPLNVVLIDKDNPGDGVVTNSATVTATGAATLVVASVSSAGARQRIPDVLSGTNIAFQVDPYTDYTAVARLKDSTETVINTWPVGHYSDNFTMPNGETTLEIIYFRGHEVTLSVVDTRGTAAPVSSAQMTEDAIGLAAITADSTGTIGVYSGLPAGTKLTSSMTTLAPGTKLIGVLVIDSTGARWLAEDTANPGDYNYILANRDVEVRMIVGPENEDNYLATVSAVNLPTEATAPQIHVTSDTRMEGAGWTIAVPNDTVTVTVVVPDDYEAELTTNNGTVLSATKMSADDTATFEMPADNTHVTVTYKKVKFSATILVRPSAGGSATLTESANAANTVTADGTLYHLAEGTDLDYASSVNTDYTLVYILATTASGVTTILDNGTGGGAGTYTMPDEDVTITVIFDDDNNRHHIAFVTTESTDGQPDNAAQKIKNTTQDKDDLLWVYGDEGDGIKVMFTVAPGYSAVVTAEYVDGSATPTRVLVTQQGGNNKGANVGDPAINATATLIMPPNTDVKVTITYSKNEPESHVLKLRLVGHGQEEENQATLYADGYGSTPNLALNGTMAPDLNDLWSPGSLTVAPGKPLDLDAGRKSNYNIVRATIGLLDPSDPTGTTLLPGTEVELPLNRYGTTATNLHYMPGADAVVTVYYRLPYQATLFVVDAAGNDYNDGMATPGPADTTATPHDRTPDVTMDVVKTDSTLAGSTTLTHTPIGELDGTETVVTTVDKKVVTAGGTMPDGDEIASVIATTASGTVHLLEDPAASTVDSGVYRYAMSDLPGRMADDVDITVILRKVDAPKMYTATVYKVGHDNKPGNTATIENPTTAGLPSGTIWTGAYEKDEPVVKVTTEPGYYAIVTAVKTGTDPAEAVPVLQWVAEGTAADPIEAIFKMPAHDVDVTVEYVTEKPKADMTLKLKQHGDKADNKGDLYNDPTAPPDLTANPSLTSFLSANGSEAPVTPPATTGDDPFSKTTTTGVDVGDYLTLVPDHATGYYIDEITFEAAGFSFDMLKDPTFIPRVPLSGGEVIIKFAPGKQSGRPYDPEHSERYNASTVWSGGNYITGDTADGNPNPDLSVYPMEEQQGWILAEDPDTEKKTVVVTVPTLFDKDDKLTDSEALADAGVDPAPPDGGWWDIPPYYQFYWYDEDNSMFKQFTPAQLSILKGEPLSYANNPKGDFPKGDPQEQHYGYRLTLKALEPAEDADPNPLIDYIENGGEIYVTATRPGYVDPTADPQVPWVESEMTQVIIKSDNVLKPYDPDNEDNPNYEDHWITSENRGDYLIVTVPMLNNKKGSNPTEVDGTKHRLQLHLQVDGTDRDSDIVNVTELLNIVNVREYEHFWNVNLEYDPNWRSDPNHDRVSYLYDETYENEIYNSDYQMPVGGWAVGEEKWHGARFVVEILTDAELEAKFTDPADYAAAKANADILWAIFDNEGTMGTNNYRMYITSDEVTSDTDPLPNFRFDDYTDFEVPRYYSLAGELQSWAPTHIAELMLYRADTSPSSYNGYELMPWLMIRSGLCETMSSTGDFDPAIYNDRWSMSFAFKSSKMAGLTYQMLVKKTSHITYLHKEIKLDTVTAPAGRYNAATLVFSFENPVSLFCGDIYPLFPGPDSMVNDRDRDMLAGFTYGRYSWNSGDGDWSESTFNPNSYAYAADLNGDGIISERDMAVLMSEFNWRREYLDYGEPVGLTAPAVAAALLLEEEPEADEEAEPSDEGEPSEELEPSEETEPGEENDLSEEPEQPEVPEEQEPGESDETPDLNDSGNSEDSENGEDAGDSQEPEEPDPSIEPEKPEPEEPEEPTEPPEEPTEPEPSEEVESTEKPEQSETLEEPTEPEPSEEAGEMPPNDSGEELPAEETENL